MRRIALEPLRVRNGRHPRRQTLFQGQARRHIAVAAVVAAAADHQQVARAGIAPGQPLDSGGPRPLHQGQGRQAPVLGGKLV